jgi:hypothetical protein
MAALLKGEVVVRYHLHLLSFSTCWKTGADIVSAVCKQVQALEGSQEAIEPKGASMSSYS